MHASPSSDYSDEELIPLSGIQHYSFCPRQWALIHIEQLWEDNLLTTEGSLQHANVDDPTRRETNGTDTITLRGLHLSSSKLGLSGVADAVEIIPYPTAPLDKEKLIKSKLFTILPIEYKHGKPKLDDCDRVQVTAQALMLEDVFNVPITKGAIFYWQTRRREYFDITPSLKIKTQNYVKEMHYLLKNGITPPPKKIPACKSCSLANICMPSLNHCDVARYLNKYLDEETS